LYSSSTRDPARTTLTSTDSDTAEAQP
jgi:hypothetical protein